MATVNDVGVGLSGQTGTGSFAGSVSPSFTTPSLGVATATSVNFGGSALNAYVGFTAWTPVFTFATPGDLSVAYGTRVAWYSRIGNIVTANFNLTCTPTFTTATGNALITGLPFANNSSSGNVVGSSLIATTDTWPSSSTHSNLYLAASTSNLQLYGTHSGGTGGFFTASEFASTVSIIIYASITYSV